MVPGLANRNGHTNKKEGHLQWGGKRIKSFEIASETWLEPGARSVIEEKSYLQNPSISRLLQVNNKKTSFAYFLYKLKFKLNYTYIGPILTKIKMVFNEI